MSCCRGGRRSRKRQSSRLSLLESTAMGVSRAELTTSRDASFTSRPPSFTRSSCLSSPLTPMNNPLQPPQIPSPVRREDWKAGPLGYAHSRSFILPGMPRAALCTGYRAPPESRTNTVPADLIRIFCRALPCHMPPLGHRPIATLPRLERVSADLIHLVRHGEVYNPGGVL